MTDQNKASAPSFFTGLFLGGLISIGASYLFMTKSGRKFTKQLLKYTEELGERTEGVEEKLTTIVEKLKTGSKTLKKSVDSKI